jgi:hypothetical protein
VIEASRLIVEGVSGAGVFGMDEGSSVRLRDVVIRDVETNPADLQGRGISIHSGAQLDAAGVLIERCAEAGMMASSPGTSVLLADVIFRDVRRSARGFGIGTGVFGGARVEAQRVAAIGLAGAGLLAGPGTVPDAPPSELVLTDVLVLDVSRAAIGASDTGMPEGREVAYGVHAGPGATVEATHLRVDRGGYGVVAIGGAVRVAGAVITGQIDAAGATAAMGQITLEDVARQSNADDEIRTEESLPAAAELPTPTAVCLDAAACP